MANDTPKPCRAFGCGGLSRDGSGYCDKHKGLASWGKWQHSRGSAASRGYGSRWQRLRKVALKRDGELCVLCLINGRVSKATHVDHITAKANGGTDSQDNLQSLCADCHKTKTATERNRTRTRAREIK